MSLVPNSRLRTENLNDKKADRVELIDTYGHKLAIIKELESRGVDIATLSLLVNNRNISITLNNGELIYTE